MEKNNKKQGSAPGAEHQPKKPLTETEFRKMVGYDLKTACALLQALTSDSSCLDQLSEFMYGQYLNRQHAEELAKQTTIEA